MQNDPMQNDPSQIPSQGDDAQTTSNKAPLPPWLRAQMGDDYQEPAAPAANADVSAQQVNISEDRDLAREREVAQLRAEVDQLRRESARNRYSYSYQERTRERGGCLTAWLILQCIGVALVAVLALVISTQGVLGLGVITLAAVVYTAISIAGLWQLKRWGYTMQMVGYVVALVISVITLCASSSNGLAVTPFSFGDVVGDVLGMIILSLLVHDRWEMFE